MNKKYYLLLCCAVAAFGCKLASYNASSTSTSTSLSKHEARLLEEEARQDMMITAPTTSYREEEEEIQPRAKNQTENEAQEDELLSFDASAAYNFFGAMITIFQDGTDEIHDVDMADKAVLVEQYFADAPFANTIFLDITRALGHEKSSKAALKKLRSLDNFNAFVSIMADNQQIYNFAYLLALITIALET